MPQKILNNPVDRLVGVYNDVIDSKLLTVAEYARSTNETEAEVQKRIEVANLMVEFLEFINAPKQFYVARDMQVAATFEELPALLKKCRTTDDKEDMKIAVFTNILMKNSGEMRNFIRGLKTIIGSEYQQEFLAEQQELAMRVVDSLRSERSTRIRSATISGRRQRSPTHSIVRLKRR